MIITFKVIGLLLMFFVGYFFKNGILTVYKEDKEKVLQVPFLALVWMIACLFLMAFPVIYTINAIVQAILY